MSQGIYISIPFCRTKCSFCNFASGVSSRALFERYVEQMCAEIASAGRIAQHLAGRVDPEADSIYLGGGTPSVLAPNQLLRLLRVIRDSFHVDPAAEITVECAPGTISDEVLDALLRCGVNRVSLGVQSFVDKECSSVGRLHSRAVTLDDIARLCAAGLANISIDLIAGLPHQTPQSWQFSVAEALATGVPHISIYMLEVDEDSRLGAELLAGGSRYHAHFVPDDDLTADFYSAACEWLASDGVQQYEISNFARPRTNGGGLHESRHNLKYWTRQPYLGFGVDAHSMLPASNELRKQDVQAVRFATPDSLEGYSAAANQLDPILSRMQQLRASRTLLDAQAALEESFFLGLRMNHGVSLASLKEQAGEDAVSAYAPAITELVADGLLQEKDDRLRLTARGRLLSNEVFARFLRETTHSVV
jgi:putative oxygen-independent coproporphyrinogen III oxidase